MATEDTNSPEYWADLLLDNLSTEPEMVMTPDFADRCRDRGLHIPDPAPDNGMELVISEHDWQKGKKIIHITDITAFIESVGGPGGEILRLIYTQQLMEG